MKTGILIQTTYVNLLPELKVWSNLEKRKNSIYSDQNWHDLFSILVPRQEDTNENKL